MPKLLLVGIIERTCRKTIIREIHGITDCFKVKEESGNTTKVLFVTADWLNIDVFLSLQRMGQIFGAFGSMLPGLREA